LKNSFPIIVAVIIAGISLLAVRSYVEKKDAEVSALLKGRPVVAARANLQAGDELSPSVIQAKKTPERFIPQQAIVGEEANMVLGRKLKYPVKPGQLILWSDLETESRGFSTLIPRGERAYTIEVDMGTASGLIGPNDRIDIIASFALPSEAGVDESVLASWRAASDMVNVVLLQNVPVIAVGDSFTADQPAGQSTQMLSLTVSLTLPECQLLMFAELNGELGAVLRRDGDVDTMTREALPRITFAQVEDLIGDLDDQRQKRTVQLYKGQRRQEVTVDGDQ